MQTSTIRGGLRSSALLSPANRLSPKRNSTWEVLLDGKAARLEWVCFSLGCNSLVDMKAKHPELSLFMRRILLTASSWIERRHGVIFGQWPWKLFQLCNPSMAQKDPRNNFYPRTNFEAYFQACTPKLCLLWPRAHDAYRQLSLAVGASCYQCPRGTAASNWF